MSIPVTNPKIPLTLQIPGGMSDGYILRIKGRMNSTEGFRINLAYGINGKMSDDRALHISVRPKDNKIVRNHRVNNKWATEEFVGGCPIKSNQLFEILIYVEKTRFVIFIDGRHFAYYGHFLSPGAIQFVNIEGAVTIEYIGREMYFPQQCPPNCSPNTPQWRQQCP